MSRITSFKNALDRCEKALVKDPFMFPFGWIIEQLKYLIDLEEGRKVNISMLQNIKIGWIAVRELDGFEDQELINLLCSISKEVEKMQQERNNQVI